jgi:gamma-glutamyltranspeptidase/glutathione hydrolase
MLHPTYATNGIAVAPHALAAQSAIAVLREGGNAIEAMVAAAATIAVVYPHMNSIGGDGFWLILPPGAQPVGIDACGRAGSLATIDHYRRAGLAAIPTRGPLAANTIAGTVSGWIEALDLAKRMGGKLALRRLLFDAIGYAQDGIAVTASQEAATASKLAELKEQAGFVRCYLPDGNVPRAGTRFRQPALGRTLFRLAEEGLDTFYRGKLATEMARDLNAVGAPVTLEDLHGQRATTVTPLRLRHSEADVYNLPPPTQGLVSLLILGILDRLQPRSVQVESPDYVHRIVEATKLAFGVRDQHIADPADVSVVPQTLLSDRVLTDLALRVDSSRALPWGNTLAPSDTIWMGVIDGSGLAVSFIQSTYHEFGSGVVVGDTGIVWQNRGASFRLDPGHLLALRPGKKPFHTLNPAGARFADGRSMVYGTMGGDGQPQTQAALFTRYAVHGYDAQAAVSAPRWLLGRTWGKPSDTLKLETRFDREFSSTLSARGHRTEALTDFDESVGHAGIAVRHPQGLFEAGSDPRSDGAAVGF